MGTEIPAGILPGQPNYNPHSPTYGFSVHPFPCPNGWQVCLPSLLSSFWMPGWSCGILSSAVLADSPHSGQMGLSKSYRSPAHWKAAQFMNSKVSTVLANDFQTLNDKAELVYRPHDISSFGPAAFSTVCPLLTVYTHERLLHSATLGWPRITTNSQQQHFSLVVKILPLHTPFSP